MNCTLYTYSGISELREIQEEHEVIPFIFAETKELLEETPAVFLEITALVYYLQVHPSDRYSAYINLREISDETIVIVDASIANEALSIFPMVFTNVMPISEESSKKEDSIVSFSWNRVKLYTYKNHSLLNSIIEYANENNIPIATFSQATGIAKEQFENFNKSNDLALLDLTSVSYAIENNKNLIYLLESLLNIYPNIKVISEESQAECILDFFPLYFDTQSSITELLPNLICEIDEDQPGISRTSRITDLSKDDYRVFMDFFNKNLIGHKYFKERLEHTLKNFISLNKVKDQKVLSIFLYGASGIGKTEVARLIAAGLSETPHFAKINFQNYSSQDALNSLIGSPAGYIGCDHGELSDKIGKSNVGILLCDEFDKTTRPVFLFFLELLEEGYFTDSMAREYDLDGYIVIFTSNIQTEAEYKKIIPPELQTRFDLVCEFEVPNDIEKREFINLLYSRAKEKYANYFDMIKITLQEEHNLLDIDCKNMNALRDIRRVFNNKLMDLFESKEIEL